MVAAPALADALEELEAAQQKLFERVAPSVVYIGLGDAFGSGFFVNADGLILTNAHVVGKATEVNVVLHNGTALKGTVVERGPEQLDLALVKVSHRPARPLPLEGFSELRVGSWVAAVGHGAGGIWTLTTGMVSNIYPDGSERPVFQTQIPLNPGNSGGPVFDRKGRVVGVVTASLKETQNINFAIRIDMALKSLKGLQGSCACLVIQAPEGTPVFVDGKLVGQGPRVVVPAVSRSYEIFAVRGGKMDKKMVTYPAQREVTLHGDAVARESR